MLPVALRNRDFRLFWGGMVVSSLGSQFTSVAMAWQIYTITGSPLDLGLIGLVRGVPQIGLVLFGGMLADAFDRRRLMMVTQFANFCVSASLVILTVTGLMTPFWLYVASAMLGVFTALENPVRVALVPNLVPREQLTNAIALAATFRSVGSIVGPSLAGLLLAFADTSWCYGVNAVGWLVMIVALMLMRVRPAEGPRRALSMSSLYEGINFVLLHPIILGFMALDFTANFLGSPRALFPIYAEEILGVGVAGLGVLYAASSVGSLSTAAGISMLKNVRNAGHMVFIGVALQATCFIIFAVSPFIWLSALMLALGGVGDMISQILRTTINQVISPDELRGRVSAVNSIFVNGGGPLGQFRSGVVAELWGAPFSAASGGLGVLAVAAGMVLLIPAMRRFQLVPDQEAAQASTPTGTPTR